MGQIGLPQSHGAEDEVIMRTESLFGRQRGEGGAHPHSQPPLDLPAPPPHPGEAGSSAGHEGGLRGEASLHRVTLWGAQTTSVNVGGGNKNSACPVVKIL